MEALRMKGLPNSSTIMMVTKERKPSPMNSAEPQGRGLGALILGQSAKRPVAGLLWQVPEPPAQFRKPDSPLWQDHISSPIYVKNACDDTDTYIKLAPMSRTTRPVTAGGKTVPIILSVRSNVRALPDECRPTSFQSFGWHKGQSHHQQRAQGGST